MVLKKTVVDAVQSENAGGVLTTLPPIFSRQNLLSSTTMTSKITVKMHALANITTKQTSYSQLSF